MSTLTLDEVKEYLQKLIDVENVYIEKQNEEKKKNHKGGHFWLYPLYDMKSFDPEILLHNVNKTIPELNVKLEYEHGGEDMGSHYELIYKFEADNKIAYVQFIGYYSSYDGLDWSYMSMNLVEPYEKTVKAWRKVQ